MQTFYLISLGCNKNLVDSEVMLFDLINNGFEEKSEPESAEIIIINTCAFIESAQQESINTILEAAEYKSKGRLKKLIVTGCLPQMYKKELIDNLPEIDVILGTGNFMELVQTIKVPREETPTAKVGEPNYSYCSPLDRKLLTPSHSAYLKIAEGCDNFCSYCIIPKLRGTFRSRPVDTIISEAQSLVNMGVKEITLIAQDTSLYGKDLAESVDLSDLLEELAKRTDASWIRFLYYNPIRISNKLLQTIKRHDNICKYLDIPIQHVNSSILKRMNRKGSYKEYYDLIAKVRDTLPGITLRTTFMVGFPGETEEEFSELTSFIEEVQFDWAAVFGFSAQKGTRAYKFHSRVRNKDIQERANIALNLQENVTEKRNSRWIGRVVPVLIEGKAADLQETLVGRTEGQSPEIDGMVYIRNGQVNSIGHFVNVLITHADRYDLIGEVYCECCQHNNAGSN